MRAVMRAGMRAIMRAVMRAGIRAIMRAMIRVMISSREQAHKKLTLPFLHSQSAELRFAAFGGFILIDERGEVIDVQ
eukprot:6634106-Prymnesium_polylepis.1